MDIKRAKQEIKDSIEAYLAKDEFGEYLIPAIRQRPILLMGAPGIGKTQIMEQIARECKVGLVSYTITHHTRQSAVGLPFIKEKTFGQETFSVTEYTMSEIIASVYEKMEKTGLREGILFIDEIHRLNRIEGQIRGIRNMLENDAYCPDILIQSAAVNAAVNAFNKELLASHIRSCVAQDIREGKEEVIDELVVTLQK